MRLHKEHGVNPYLVKCVRCGADTQQIALLGSQVPKPEQIIDGRYIITGDICDECKEEIDKFAEMVKCGGIYWKCKDCHVSGVIKPGPDADNIRKEVGIEAPEACGVILSKINCPSCGESTGERDD